MCTNNPSVIESVAGVFEEDQSEDDVLVDGGIERGAQTVGGVPEFLVEVVQELLFHVVHTRLGSLSGIETDLPEEQFCVGRKNPACLAGKQSNSVFL